MKSTAVFVCTLSAVASVVSSYEAPGPYYDQPAAYAYNYGVADGYSGAYYNAGEQRDGYATSGSYSVALPDGRVQTVNYRVADANSGYVADVQYSGAPHYHPYSYSTYPYKSTYSAAPVYAPLPVYKPSPVHKTVPAYSG